MVMMQTAREWGVRPSALGLCSSEDDLVYMVALVRVEGQMRAWEQQLAEARIKKAEQQVR